MQGLAWTLLRSRCPGTGSVGGPCPSSSHHRPWWATTSRVHPSSLACGSGLALDWSVEFFIQGLTQKTSLGCDKFVTGGIAQVH